MKIKFSKYQGTGNDFVLIDNRDELFDANNIELVNRLCDRRFGIGGDGLMLLENSINTSFKMRYFNSDGKEGSMCGNGGRCIAAFAVHNKLIINPQHFTFDAVDGLHEAKYSNGVVSLKMSDVDTIEKMDNDFFLNTGSPHYVKFTENVDKISVYTDGKVIRWSEPFQPSGTNVNFVTVVDQDHIKVRTFERGVEDETLSCGTGVVASSIASHLQHSTSRNLQIKVLGGELAVSFDALTNGKIANIWLTGAATFVFEGYINI